MHWNETKYGIKIVSLKLDDFRPFGHLNVDFDDNLTVLIGDNGSGKSTILDATAALLQYLLSRSFQPNENTEINLSSKDVKYGTVASIIYLDVILFFPKKVKKNNEDDENSGELEWKQEEVSIQIGLGINRETGRLRFLDDEKIEQFLKSLEYYRDEIDSLPILIYYGCNELDATIHEVANSKLKYQTKRQKVYQGSLTPERFNFTSFYEWYDRESRVSNQRRVKSDLLRLVDEKICYLLNEDINNPTYRNLQMDYQSNGDALSVEVKTNGTWVTREVDQMSSGQKSLIALGGDIMRRIVEANSNLDDPLSGPGVVLIDEIDLHLHPIWQRMIVPKLNDIFPSIQFIITTHSPFVLQSFSKGRIISLPDLRTWQTLIGWETSEIMKEVMAEEEFISALEFTSQFEKFSNAILYKNSFDLENSYSWLINKTNPTNPLRSAIQMQYDIFFRKGLYK